MPLVKKAQVPAATPTPAVESAAPAVAAPSVPAVNQSSLESRLAKLEAKDRHIMINGASSAAATSVGAVQHGGGKPESYYARVEELTRTLLDHRLKLLGL